MTRVRRSVVGLTLTAALAAGLTVGLPYPATAKVYKWVDENGVAHYTVDRDEIPPELRRRLRPATGAPVGDPGEPAPPTRGGVPQLTPEAEPQTATPGPTTPLPTTPTTPTTPTPAPTVLTPEPGESQPEPAPVALRTPDEEEPSGVLPQTALLPEQSPELSPERSEMLDLESRILADRETLKNLISQPSSPDAAFASDPEVREIAERLPRLQAQLEELRREAAQ